MNRSLEIYERRAAAYLVDFLIATIIGVLIDAYLVLRFESITQLHFSNLLFILPFVSYAIINFLSTWIFNGKTIGGFIFRIKIVNQDYQVIKKRLGFFTCLVRAICLAVYTIVFASFFYMLVKKTTIAYFDKIAHTLVIAG